MPQALSIGAQSPRNCCVLGSSVNSQQYTRSVIAVFHLLCASGLRNCQKTVSSNPHSCILMRFPFFFLALLQFHTPPHRPPPQLFHDKMIQITQTRTDSSECLSRVIKECLSSIIIISRMFTDLSELKKKHVICHITIHLTLKCIQFPHCLLLLNV